MAIRQISVFLENNAGRLGDVTRTLALAEISIRAISIADTADFGILRLVVDKCDRALQALNDRGFTTRVSDVLAVEIDDIPGSLAQIMELFQQSNANIEYLYASLKGMARKAVVIFKLADYEQGLGIIKKHGLMMVEEI